MKSRTKVVTVHRVRCLGCHTEGLAYPNQKKVCDICGGELQYLNTEKTRVKVGKRGHK